MRDDFRPVLKILLRFVVLYVLLLLAYQLYLNPYTGRVDPYSALVAREAGVFQNYFGYKTVLVPAPEQESIWFYLGNKYTSRMVEGCNAISVMILYLAFIFAFYKGAKTFLYAGVTLLVLHILNFLRIGWLNMIIVDHPAYAHMGHQYFFPAVIYGCVVLFWLVWVKFFAVDKPLTR